MAVQVYRCTLNAGATNSGLLQALSAENKSLGVTVLSTYQATAGTTGVKLLVGGSIDGGATYSDYALIATTAPTASSGSQVSSQAFAALDAYKNATHLQFALVNLDGANNAAVTLTFRAAA